MCLISWTLLVVANNDRLCCRVAQIVEQCKHILEGSVGQVLEQNGAYRATGWDRLCSRIGQAVQQDGTCCTVEWSKRNSEDNPYNEYKYMYMYTYKTEEGIPKRKYSTRAIESRKRVLQ